MKVNSVQAQFSCTDMYPLFVTWKIGKVKYSYSIWLKIPVNVNIFTIQMCIHTCGF